MSTYGELDEGIRHIVWLLNQHGYETTDSGDGTRAVPPEDCGWGEPMVAVTVPTDAKGDRLASWANRLRDTIRTYTDGDFTVEASLQVFSGTAHGNWVCVAYGPGLLDLPLLKLDGEIHVPNLRRYHEPPAPPETERG